MKMDDIAITEIHVFPIRPQGGLVAFASCLFDANLSLNSIAIYTRPDGSGYRLVYPMKMLPNGKEISTFYPINKDIADILDTAIIGKYEKVTENVMKRITNDSTDK